MGVPRDVLMQDVEEFAAQADLNDMLPMLRKGALVAQSPHNIDHIDELDESERANLHDEVAHRWRHPKILYYTIILNSIAGQWIPFSRGSPAWMANEMRSCRAGLGSNWV